MKTILWVSSECGLEADPLFFFLIIIEKKTHEKYEIASVFRRTKTRGLKNKRKWSARDTHVRVAALYSTSSPQDLTEEKIALVF